MLRSSWLSLAFVALVLTGCSPDGEWTTDQAVHTVDGDQIDLHFQPLSLRSGEQVDAEIGTVRLTSTARASDVHEVSLDAPGRAIRATAGVLDGVTQLTTAPTGDGGVTSMGPTSVHRSTVCGNGRCYEYVEYDYDMHDPAGDGTTSWRTPDGRSATIDRLRFELETVDSKQTATLRLTTPEPAVMVHSRVMR